MSIGKPSNGGKIRRRPVHPGEMRRGEFLVPFGLSANRLAIELRAPVTSIGPAGGGSTDLRRNKTAPEEGRVTGRGSISMRTMRNE
jgi:hypothetical protein